MKYLDFTDKNCCGFGNQLRSLLGWACLSELIGAKMTVSSKLVKDAFDLKVEQLDTSSLSSRNCIPKSREHFNQIDFLNIKEDLIIAGGPEPMFNYVVNHPQLKGLYKKYKVDNKIVSAPHHFYSKVINGISNNLKSSFKKYNFLLKEDFGAIQFRSFFDYRYKNILDLPNFIEGFKGVIKNHPNIKNIFITSDSPAAIAFIKYSLEEYSKINFISSEFSQCSNCGRCAPKHSNFKPEKCSSLEDLRDWGILTQSNFIYSNHTSFSDSASQIFSILHYIFEHRDGIVKKL